ncbi:hypothetical protein BKA81DRAFT_370964 [Phyllosticta paracitricarpa]
MSRYAGARVCDWVNRRRPGDSAYFPTSDAHWSSAGVGAAVSCLIAAEMEVDVAKSWC